MSYKPTIFGVVISYFPSTENITNLISTSKQVDKLVVVDNGSDENQIELMRKIVTEHPNIELICNGDNLGIDKATNIGIKSHFEEYDWVLTLDQDSILTEGMVETMLSAYYEEIEKTGIKVGEIVPRIVDIDIIEYTYKSNNWHETTNLTIASGKIFSTSVFSKVGFMSEWCFIDGADFEFTLQLRKHGYRSIVIDSAINRHKRADVTDYYFLGKYLPSNNYSPIRRYYMTRNYLYLFSKYLFYDFKNISTVLWRSWLEFIKVMLVEPDKKRKLKYTLMGVRDFILQKKGKLQE
jgi:rhamnosyltransferase